MLHPRNVLLGLRGAANIPVCDHYCGIETRMRKSLAMQAEMTQEFGACVFDVTLDCEDGAPVGGEKDHAEMVLSLIKQAYAAIKTEAVLHQQRIAVRVHPVDHPAFEQDVQTLVGGAGGFLCHLMVPKIESLVEVERVVQSVDQAERAPRSEPLPIHVLLESPAAVQRAFDIAAHPRVQSISFGLMDFVSAHGGAIPVSAISTSAPNSPSTLDQFTHPLVLRAKLEISAACHAYGKVPSHCVVTEFNDTAALTDAARRASHELGFTRMWSIHPDQIRPILAAFAPSEDDIALASRLVRAAARANWAPISFDGKLHDRASFRYFWHLLERAHQTGKLPATDPAQVYFSQDAALL